MVCHSIARLSWVVAKVLLCSCSNVLGGLAQCYMVAELFCLVAKVLCVVLLHCYTFAMLLCVVASVLLQLITVDILL